MEEFRIVTDNPISFYMIIGLALLGFDIVIIGTSPIMFFAVGAIATSLILMVTGWQLSFAASLALWGVASVVVAAFGWPLLKRFQHTDVQEDESSDLIGREMTTTGPVSKTGGEIMFSGTPWRARLEEAGGVEKLDTGMKVRVVKVKDLTLILRPL